MCGQSVHERLSKLGAIKNWKVSDANLGKIRALYGSGFKKGDGKLQSLCEELGFTKSKVCGQAKKMGLTNRHRNGDDSIGTVISARMKSHWSANDHPRGALGLKHSDSAKSAVSEAHKKRFDGMSATERTAHSDKGMKTKIERYGRVGATTPRGKWKAEWVELGGKRLFSRSRWESNYARYLEFLKVRGDIVDWHHEPKVFIFEGVPDAPKNYLPDFSVEHHGGQLEYHEVKGWMCPRSVKTIERMATFHPEITLEVFDGKWFLQNSALFSEIIPGWEKPSKSSVSTQPELL